MCVRAAMIFRQIVVPLYLVGASMISSEDRWPLFGIML
jgi:hypothetical protein